MKTELGIDEKTRKWIEGLLILDFVGVFSLLYLLWLIAMRFFGFWRIRRFQPTLTSTIHGAAVGGSGGANPTR